MTEPLPSVTESELHDLAMLYLSWETAFKVLSYKAPQTNAVTIAMARLHEELFNTPD